MQLLRHARKQSGAILNFPTEIDIIQNADNFASVFRKHGLMSVWPMEYFQLIKIAKLDFRMSASSHPFCAIHIEGKTGGIKKIH